MLAVYGFYALVGLTRAFLESREVIMEYILKNATAYIDNSFKKVDISVLDGIIVDISSDLKSEGSSVYDLNNCYIYPGFVDVHVHLREPGFSYKETIKTGSMACAKGGYTTVFTMPNLHPVPDSVKNIKKQLDIIKKDAAINVYPYASITKSELGMELSDIEELAPYAIAYSDDGKGVQNKEVMLEAMKKAKALDKIIAAHCEDNALLNGGYIHDGKYAKEHNHRGICSESEYMPIKRDIELAKETKVKYHVCHVSTKESVELIRNAKKNGVDITCETAPHYLVLSDKDLEEDGRFKMNPPLRDESDRLALIEGIKDGTIDMIATDHAPHSAEEKSKGLEKSAMGISGIETAYPVLYTQLVKKNVITLEKLIELLSIAPSKRFNIGSELKIGKKAELTVYDNNIKYKINPDEFISMGKSTPFKDFEVYGKCLMTISGNNIYKFN